jgi:large subunit ribosomal protein L4
MTSTETSTTKLTLDVKVAGGKTNGTVDLPAEIFDAPANIALLHQVVVAQLAAARQGTHSTKTRGEVRGGGKKPYRQKGTGRARAGMSSSPLWRGGGRIFPNTPDENFSHKVNKKMFRAGICSIFSQLAREGRLNVVENLSIEAPKTKLLSQKLQGMGLESVLVITDTIDENLELASRNLPNVLVVEPKAADPMSLVFYKKVLVTKAALAKIEEMYA